MVSLGYALSSEEHAPADLVRHAELAEGAGFEFAFISDHFHPWLDRQGHSPFVWSTIGAIAAKTTRLRIGTGVTCPTIRIHPAIIAQAAATSAVLLEGRFILGVGSGEALNEHITGARWPEIDVRLEMLEEAIDVMRKLWQGGYVSHHGRHYDVENARLYTLPDEPPPVYIAASGPKAGALVADVGDGLISTGPEADLVKQLSSGGGNGRGDRPAVGQVTVCWAKDEATARRTAFEWWPTAAISGDATQELPLPVQFDQLASLATEDSVAEAVTCGPDPERHVARIREYIDAGYSHVYVHQVGPDQPGMIDFYEREVLPRFA
jgi:coenzyme F420-dependent glucose-6-phosphate dehydrogenase